MGTPWSAIRRQQWEADHPPVERREQKRLAQARYRERHAERLTRARQVSSILMHHGDMARLAAALGQFLSADDIRELRLELLHYQQ